MCSLDVARQELRSQLHGTSCFKSHHQLADCASLFIYRQDAVRPARGRVPLGTSAEGHPGSVWAQSTLTRTGVQAGKSDATGTPGGREGFGGATVGCFRGSPLKDARSGHPLLKAGIHCLSSSSSEGANKQWSTLDPLPKNISSACLPAWGLKIYP